MHFSLQVAGVADEDVIYASFVNQPLGSTPYFIVRDVPRRTVVLNIRGSASMADLVTDLVGTCLPFHDWLPEEFVQRHGLHGRAHAHEGLLAAARAVLQDLNRHQILHTLLTGQPQEESSTDEPTPAQRHENRSPEEYRKILEERRVDCKGWDLVVCGHSLGAAVAALLVPHFEEWVPGKVTAWAFCPPGGLLSRKVAAALEPLVTSIIVGKDSISRTSTVSFDRLQDEVVVALARTKLSKSRVLFRIRSSGLRALPPSAVFYPLEEIPREALRYLYSYFLAKCEYCKELEPMLPPGMCIFLRRVNRNRSSSFEKRKGAWRWDAVSIEREWIVEEGILLSRHQVSDHYSQTLVQALDQLTNEQ